MEKDRAILMADLSGYTAMTDIHGGASAAMMVKKYMTIVDQSLRGSTQLIQRVGDQIVLIAENPNDILDTAIALNKLTQGEEHFLSIHTGIHYGPVFIEEGHLFGSTINVTSRIMNMAESGQVLCSSQLYEKINMPELRCKHLGEFSFKNVRHPVSVYEVQLRRADSNSIDPVCRMQIDSTKAMHTYIYLGKEYHFCGERCLSLFQKQPKSFL